MDLMYKKEKKDVVLYTQLTIKKYYDEKRHKIRSATDENSIESVLYFAGWSLGLADELI
jgi:hypothetical protein